MDTIYIKNARRIPDYSVRLHKVDSCCQSVGLMGAVFDLLKYDEATGHYVPLRTNLVTDSKGLLLVESLDIGRYKFAEAIAPQGYSIGMSSETFFEIVQSDCACLKEITVTNCKVCSPCVPCCGQKTQQKTNRNPCEQERQGLFPETICYLENKSYGEIKRYFEDCN